MTIQNDVISETIVHATGVHIAIDPMEYRECTGSKETRRKKSKRRRNHRKTQKSEKEKLSDVSWMPSIFRHKNDDKTICKSPERGELSRLILPKLETRGNSGDFRQEVPVKKCEERHFVNYALPKINSSGTLTTRSLSYVTCPDFGEHLSLLPSSPIEEDDMNNE